MSETSFQALRVTTCLAILATLVSSPPPCRAAENQREKTRVRQLQDLKFGMFICWSFSTFSDKEWTPGIADVSFFNPTGMDTDQWARVAKDAGMSYILFLTKHHDGFCLWDTKTTDRKVTRSPLGKDVLAAVRKSCDKYGLKLALYFSEGDWTWPGAVDGKSRPPGGNPEMKKAQLEELCTQYGPIVFFWMDHAVGDGGLSHEQTVAWVKRFQPDCFVGFNNGPPAGDLRPGELGRPGPLNDPDAAGPFGHRDRQGYDKYLVGEFAVPIIGPEKRRWFYTSPANDNACLPAAEIYRLYLGAIEYGNIFSLDVGPDRTGRLRDIDVRTLAKVGQMIRDRAPCPATTTAPMSPPR